ncbi:MAG: hypothetical protein AAGA85_15475 [Bacteroidota bacterium]
MENSYYLSRLAALMLCILIVPLAAEAQTRRLNPSLREQLQTRAPASHNVAVKARGTTSVEMDSANIDQIRMSSQEQLVIAYDREIGAADANLKSEVQRASSLTAVDELKVIPEFYVGGTSPEEVELNYQILFTSLSPLRYDFDEKVFRGRLGFILHQETEEGDKPEITDPVLVEVHSDRLERVDPMNISLDHLGIPTSNIDLEAQDVEDSVRVKVITEASNEGYDTYLEVKPALEIYAGRTEVQGFGVQKTPINVRFIGSSSSEVVEVNLSTSQGSLNPSTVELPLNGEAEVYLRSEGIGTAQLMATASGFADHSTVMNFKFPWAFLGFAIVGGFVGALIKYYVSKENQGLSFQTLVIGILTGLIGAIAFYVLGINLLGLDFDATFNEFAVLGLSALIALLGPSRLIGRAAGE